MKSYLKILALLLILTLAISGCVNDKNTSKAESAQSNASSAQSNTSKEESTTSVPNESSNVSTTETVFSYADYKAAVEKTEKLKNVNFSIKEQYDVDAGGVKVPSSMEADIKVDFDKQEASIQLTTGASGINMEMLTYFADGYTYTDFMGTKMKVESTFEEAIITDLQPGSIVESAIVSSSEETVDGIKYHKIIVSGKDFLDLEMANSLKEQMQQFPEVEAAEIGINDVNILFLYEDGYIVKTKMEAKVTFDDGETEITIDYSSERTLNNPGDPVEIEEPENLGQYVEAEM